ncbi:MAG: efflux RND transporter periplasmic adaptor subunit [Candidatus Cryptobacteroides sp.]
MNTKLFTLAAVVLCLSSCGSKKASQQAVEAKLPAVKIVEAVSEEVDVNQSYSVTLKAFAVNNIAPQAGNRIKSIKAEVGDFVSKGQVLAEMDRLQLDQAELQLANLKSELERITSLYKKGGVSQSDYESMELQYKVSQTQYENLLTNTILKSPLDGVVSARNYDEGDMYTMSSPLYVVQQINPMKVLVNISEKDYSQLKTGLKVEIFPDALNGKVFEGKISRIYPTIDPVTHTVAAEIEIPNPNSELRPGMYSTANVIFSRRTSILVPDSAVLKQQGSGVRTVYVLNSDNSVSSRVVELGRHLGDKYEILSGLKDGEKVVISGQGALRNGCKVEVLKK